MNLPTILPFPDKSEFEVYPNPGNSTVKIVIKLLTPQQINVSIFNILGERVLHVFDGHEANGSHTYIAGMDTFASGIYFVRYQNETDTFEKRITLIK